MIIYFNVMRVKDALKQDALFKATVKLVNEIGFVSSSVAKIAKEAGISPATVYIYYKNKEDLLVSTYLNIKKEYCAAMLEGFDESKPIRDIFRKAWYQLFTYIEANPADFQFTEQFANSPYTELVNKKEIDDLLMPLFKVVHRGIEEKVIKDVSMDILGAFIFYPILTLANKKLCAQFSPKNQVEIDTAFKLAWDAIKL